MDTQKEIKLFEELLLANPDFDESLLAKDEDGYYEDCEIGDQLGIFQAGIEVAEREARMNAKAQVPEWNSVDDKEPPLGTMVLICWSDAPDVEPEKDYMDHDVDHGVNYWANYNDGDEPSHWMLLPKPVAQEQN